MNGVPPKCKLNDQVHKDTNGTDLWQGMYISAGCCSKCDFNCADLCVHIKLTKNNS